MSTRFGQSLSIVSFVLSVFIALQTAAQVPLFDPVPPSGLPYSVIIESALVNEGKLPDSAQIGLFDGNLCVGAGFYRSDEILQLVAWESDAIQNLEGFVPGRSISIRLRVPCISGWAYVDADADFQLGDGTYGSGNFSLVHLTATDSTCLPFCSTPNLLETDRIAERAANLSWHCPVGFSDFQLRGRELGSSNWLELAFPDGSPCTFRASGLRPATAYEWQLRRNCDVDHKSLSCWSATDTFQTSCDPPQVVSTSNISANSATANWTAVNAAQGYELRGKKIGRPWLSFDLDQSTTDLTINSLRESSVYAWQVRAICDSSAESYSKFSAIDTFSTSSLKNSLKIDKSGSIVYPNPFSESFTINHSGEFDDCMIKVIDLNGKVVLHSNGSIKGKQNFAASFAPGSYLLIVEGQDLRLIEPLIKVVY